MILKGMSLSEFKRGPSEFQRDENFKRDPYDFFKSMARGQDMKAGPETVPLILGWLLDHPFAGLIKTISCLVLKREFLVSALLGFRVFGAVEKRPALRFRSPAVKPRDQGIEIQKAPGSQACGQDMKAGPETVPLIRGWAGSWTIPLPD